MADLGEDFAGVGDVDADWSFVSGRLALAQAVAERLFEETGGLFYDPNYGAGALNLLGTSGVSLRAANLEEQALRDERVEACDAEVTFDEATQAFSINVTIDDGDGPFTFVLKPSDLTVDLLDGIE